MDALEHDLSLFGERWSKHQPVELNGVWKHVVDIFYIAMDSFDLNYSIDDNFLSLIKAFLKTLGENHKFFLASWFFKSFLWLYNLKNVNCASDLL